MSVEPLLIGLAGGGVATLLGLPVPWLIGPLLLGMAAAVGADRKWQLAPGLIHAAQAVIGIALGARFSFEAVAELRGHLPAVVAILAAATALSLANGYLLSRFTWVDYASAFLGSVPGAASGMVAASEQVGADARIVAVLQYVRVVVILLFAPTASSLWLEPSGVAGGAPTASEGATSPWTLFLLAALALAGSAVGRRLRFPSPYMLGTLVVTLVVASTGLLDFAVPDTAFNAAMAVIGTAVGVRFDGRIVRSLGRVVAIEAGLVVALLAASAGLGFLLHRLTGVDLPTAVLGTVPGGMEGIVATAVELDLNASAVAAMQMLRSIAMLVVGPSVARALRRRVDDKAARSERGIV